MAGRTTGKKTPAKRKTTGQKDKTAKQAVSGEAGLLILESHVVLTSLVDLKQRMTEFLALDAEIKIDAGGVKEIDTAGLQLLAALVNQAEAQIQRLTWVGVSPRLKHCVRTLGMDAIFDFDSETLTNQADGDGLCPVF